MKINLQKSFFGERKQDLIEYGAFKIEAFKYSQGVEGLHIQNKKCSFEFTPFKGQQIWHLFVGDKEISMKTEIDEPQATNEFFKTYGAFIYHCGIMSFGGADSVHPHHGELPNAIYDSAYIICDEDEGGKFIKLGGEHHHNASYQRRYKFSPEIKLYEDSAVFKITVKIDNLRAYPLEYMYLCHLNFRPEDGAELLCSAKKDKEHIKFYRSDNESKKMADFLDKAEADLSVLEKVGAADECYDPEVCFGVKYEADESGRAYTMQYKEEGSCFVSHPASILTNGVRWISRTKNEDAMGMVLPATAEHLGYDHAVKTGQTRYLGANESLEFYMEAGYLEKEESINLKKKIETMIK